MILTLSLTTATALLVAADARRAAPDSTFQQSASASPRSGRGVPPW
ncbi:hypothetical protein HBB16_13935 [Pseudonocardia sp. MCCB 268]|nr:hypothetical protein [Pseudonocardia cytotoxica]